MNGLFEIQFVTREVANYLGSRFKPGQPVTPVYSHENTLSFLLSDGFDGLREQPSAWRPRLRAHSSLTRTPSLIPLVSLAYATYGSNFLLAAISP